MMRHNLLLPAVVACLALAASARATVLLPGDLGDLARGASLIVRGTVVSVRAGWLNDRHRVGTVVTLDVAETFKGTASRQVSFQVPGGTIGRYRSVTVGAPEFTAGEEVIVCLGAKAPQLPYVLGLSQGVFRIGRDASTGQRVVTTPVLVAGRTTTAVRRGDPARKPLGLPAFSATLQAALTSSRPQRPAEPRPNKGAIRH